MASHVDTVAAGSPQDTAAFLAQILAHVAAGGSVLVMSYTRPIVLAPANFAAWEKVGKPLLRLARNGSGLYLRSGKSSVFVFTGSLRMVGGAV